MKLTLAFQIFNKGPRVYELLGSWFSTLSGTMEYEAIVVCDACRDDSHRNAVSALATLGRGRWDVVDTDDVYEIAANNLALNWASEDSDYIVFIQDDNYQYDRGWDLWLMAALKEVERPGAVALLAGGRFRPDGATYERIETQRPHKGQHFTKHGIDPDAYPPALYAVDFITRPFAVSTSQLRAYGGLGGPEFDVICFDDTDLSVKLLRDGYTNLYLPLDVVNLCGGQTTMPERMAQGFQHNRAVFLGKHQDWLAARSGNTFRMIRPLSWKRE